jgi:BNR/Asp-box repeat
MATSHGRGLACAWNRGRRDRLKSLVALSAAIVTLVVLAGVFASASAVAPAGHLEVNVMNEPVRGGEPELAVNPLRPQEVVFGHTVVGNSYTNSAQEAGEQAVDGGLQVSHDGGKTWSADHALHTSGYSEGPNPYLIAHGLPSATGFKLTINGAGDPIEASGPDGSLYAGGVIVNTVSGGTSAFGFTVPQGAIAVARSTNGGRTFGPISAVLSDQEVGGMVSRGMTPKGIPTVGVIPYDRPWIAVDQSNGAVYVSTTGHPQRYVAVSHDKAKTWGEIEALDCDEATPPAANHAVSCSAYPQIGDGNIAAADGTLAAVYTSSAAPGSTCPCAIFETSTDAGAHWNRHVLEASIPNTSGLYVAADPSQKGRFAVLFMPGNMVSGGLAGLPASKNVPQEVQVLSTTNSGKTWSTPVTLGNESTQHITNRPWIAYGPTGVLAASWRNAYPPYDATSFLVPGTQNVFAAVSRNNGKTFSTPVQLNSAPSPPPDPKQLAEDDVGWVTVTKQYVYGAWGDWRPTSKNPVAAGSSPPSGEMNAWIARVPISAFKG